MSDMDSRPLVVFIVGPTACGKSDFAVISSERSKGEPSPEIINCDSVQFFDGVEIGAAKPSRALLERAPHHLFGHMALGASYNAGDFRRDALKVIERRQSESGVRKFLAVGGSGFYVQALAKGMYDVPDVREGVREALEAEAEKMGGWLSLYTELEQRDPLAAKAIAPQDRYRILRALEILRSNDSGETLTEIRARFEALRPPAPFRVATIGLFRSRERLRELVTLRTKAMLDMGLIEEVTALRAKGLGSWPPLASVGYKEVQEYLDGKLPFEDLQSSIVTSTMQLAKRQMTWFKRDQSVVWFDVDEEMGLALAVEHSTALLGEP